MAATIRINENFRQLAKAHSGEIEPQGELMLEILAAVRRIDQEDLFDLMDQLVEEHGSIEKATAAVKSGEVQFNIHDQI